MQGFMTINDICRYLGCSRSHFYKIVEQQNFPQSSHSKPTSNPKRPQRLWLRTEVEKWRQENGNV